MIIKIIVLFILFIFLFITKKEAIDFLLKKVDGDINKFEKLFKGKLDPTNRSITVKGIDDTIDCIKQFKDFKKIYQIHKL